MVETTVRKPRSKIVPKYLRANLAAYPHETTIHGVKYLAKADRSLFECIFWIVIFIISFFCLGYFVTNIIQNWIESPVMLVDNKLPTYIFRVPFPAITICPAIKSPYLKIDSLSLINTSTFWETELGKRTIMKTQLCRPSFSSLTEQILKMNARKSPMLETNWKDTLVQMSPKLNEVLESCQISCWYNNAIPKKESRICQKYFSPIITNEGVCFTFNTVAEVLRNESLHHEFSYYDIKNSSHGWNPEKGYSEHYAYPYKATSDGLQFTFIANSSDISPTCNPPTLGYKIILHSPAVYPHTRDRFIALEYGMEYIIAIKPKTISTSRSLKSLSPETRQCYFQNERQLKYYTYYNEINCKLECYTNYTMQIFGGVPFSSPRGANIANSIFPSGDFGWKLPINLALFHAYDKVYNISGGKLYRSRGIDTDCNCLPECSSLEYDYEILTTNTEFVQSLKATLNYSSATLRTSLDIIFEESSFVGKKRVEMYTFATLISDFGGLMGLFLGGSILSLFELLYFLIIRNHYRQN